MSELHPDSKVDVMATGAKIPVSAMSSIEQQTEASNLPILVGVNDMYGENLSDTEECFVLVDDRSVRVMSGGSAVQQLLSNQEPTISAAAEKTVQVMQMDGSKALEIMNNRNKETIEVVQMNDGRTVEVLPMEDGKTVEVVQMDGDKTLEVMHVDAVKHSEVIHVDGSSSIELLSVGTSLKGPTLTSATPAVYQKSKEKYILSSQSSETTPTLALKRTLNSENGPSSVALSLNSLAPVNSSFVLTAPKNSLLSSHQFAHMSTVTTLATSRQSQVMENDLESLTQVTPSIVLSGNKKVIPRSVDGLDNTIIISWPTVASKLENCIETQTEPYLESGPSLNLFLCTFHRDGSVETQCDFPVQIDVSVSTNSSGRCGTKVASSFTEGGGNSGIIKAEGNIPYSEGTDSRSSRSGQPFKLKESLFKSSADPLCKNETFSFDMEGNEGQDCSNENSEGIVPFRKKRGRKKKKRYPSNDDYDYDMEFDMGSEENEVAKEERVKGEYDIKDEPVDEDDEVALNILKTKGYGLRTKRRLKKLSDMHYLEEKVVKKKTERTQHFPCQWCREVFPTFTRLQRHAKEEHNTTDFAFPCEQCGVVFTRPHNLERHKDTKHGDGEKRFVCDHCGRRFGRQDVLSVHISMVHFKKSLQGKSATSVFGPNTFHCTGCDQFFSKEQKLKTHRKGDHSCSDCKLSFECKASLRTHQYKHHPTSCSECGKLCDSKQQMYLHRLSHDPKYVCNICQKGFLWKSQYAVHMSTHTGEKPVSCDICGKSFAHKLAVNKHKWQEHDESNKKFRCATCGKCFVYKGKLQSHMRSHTGEKPFMCNLCPTSFSQRCNLTAHIRSVHGVYIQSIKSDGTTQTQLVKYKRVKKQSPLETQPTVVNAVMTQPVESSVPEQPPQIAIQEQVQMSESFETEAAVYQIVYAYQQ